MKKTKQVAFLLALSVLGLSFLGCGGGPDVDLGRVHGTVTMDGEPLAGVHVTFRSEGGRPSVGVADDKGHYEVSFTGAGAKGAQLGPCVVSIAWPEDLTGAAIPAEFTNMDREIKDGTNEFNFDMKSE